MSPLDLGLVALGIALLYGGGEALVRGAVDLALRLGVSPMVIGLTVVSFATSAPELAATLTAALEGSPDLGVGNVLGSNVANIGLILGLAVLIRPIRAKARFVRREIPFMIGVTLLLYPLMRGGVIGRAEGLLLLALLVVYLWVLFRSDEPEVEHELEEVVSRGAPMSLGLATGLIVAGLLLLVGGAEVLVTGAVNIARAFGVAERVIGLTLVAFGTSLPELASSIVAARRQEGDIVLGNVVGSNVFNILCILGTTSVVTPLMVSAAAVRLDFWVVTAFSLALVPALVPNLRLSRGEGLLLVAGYFGYVTWLFL